MLRDQIYELRALVAENSNLPPWKKQELLAGRDDCALIVYPDAKTGFPPMGGSHSGRTRRTYAPA